jgi:pre-mRNA-splicing factor ISY1
MLFRFRAQQAAELGIVDVGRTRRPRYIGGEKSVPVCEKWRAQVVREVGRKVSKIMDDSLSDPQIRELNDEINRLMREKSAWEAQIRSLGGPNYGGAGKVLDAEGKEIPGSANRGYRFVILEVIDDIYSHHQILWQSPRIARSQGAF